jgi:hypothetical protein
VRSWRIWRAAIGLTVAIGTTCMVLGQDGQSSSASTSTAPASTVSGSPALPDFADPFLVPTSSAPNGGSPGAMPSRRGFGSGARGFGNSVGDPLFPNGSGVSPPREGFSGGGNGFGAGNGTGSFDWTKFFTDAARSSFEFAAPRLFSTSAQSGMRTMGGGASLVDLGDGLLRSAGASSSGAVGSSLDLLSEAARIERRGLNLTLNDPEKNSSLGVRFSFQEAMGHNSLLGGGANSFGSVNSFGSTSSFGSLGSNGMYGTGNGFGSGMSGPGGGKHGGSGASSQVSVQFKF